MDNKNKDIKNNNNNKEIYDFQPITQLGEGATGKVWAVRNKKNKKMALKLFNVSTETGLTSKLIWETIILEYLKNQPHIIKIDKCDNGIFFDNYCIVILDCYDMDLKEYILKHHPISDITIKHILYQIVIGIQSCHKNHIIHRDIKPNNIFIKKRNRRNKIDVELVIGDFGHSKFKNLIMSPKIGTKKYLPPEIDGKNLEYDEKIDIWGLGCLIYTLVYSKFNIEKFSDILMDKKIQIKDSQLDDLFKKVIKRNPYERPDINEIIKHSYFDQVRNDYIYFDIDKKKEENDDSLSLKNNKNKIWLNNEAKDIYQELINLLRKSNFKNQTITVFKDIYLKIYKKFKKKIDSDKLYLKIGVGIIYMLVKLTENDRLLPSDLLKMIKKKFGQSTRLSISEILYYEKIVFYKSKNYLMDILINYI
jgi:serine/threonine protein kinase